VNDEERREFVNFGNGEIFQNSMSRAVHSTSAGGGDSLMYFSKVLRRLR